MAADYSEVTELAGTEVSEEQIERMSHRYTWASRYCRGLDVVEAACGSGQGLGILLAAARSLEAGDYSESILSGARYHYGERVRLQMYDAASMPYADHSKDVIILFEALYYLPSASAFLEEVRRVLRPRGHLLIATANKDLSDFNPSPLSTRYYGAVELTSLLESGGFDAELFGYLPVSQVSLRQRVLRPVKSAAVALGLVPKTMSGKKLLKRLVFGRLAEMPAELPVRDRPIDEPQPVAKSEPDRIHKVLYCCATLRT